MSEHRQKQDVVRTITTTSVPLLWLIRVCLLLGYQ